VVVLTGGAGRIERGLDALKRGWSERLLVSGVDRSVKPYEFAIQYRVRPRRMACCVTLGYQAMDTQSNALETAEWLRQGDGKQDEAKRPHEHQEPHQAAKVSCHG